jgi:hypothetical protein
MIDLATRGLSAVQRNNIASRWIDDSFYLRRERFECGALFVAEMMSIINAPHARDDVP